MRDTDFLYMNKTTLGHILDWCVREYGHSTFIKHGLLKYKMNPRTYAKGWFYPEDILIEVNPKIHTSLVDFIHTSIHEYTHYLQDQKMYEKYARTNDDSTNPMEIEADMVANRDKRRCLRYIKKILE